MRFDLHLHSCLSGCASLEMSPRAIARLARERGLDGLALSDHNSALNLPAMSESCRREGLALLAGIEVCTVEEAHVVCLFDQIGTALDLGRELYELLPPRLNRPVRFGDQAVVNAADEVEQLVPRWLSNAAGLSLAALAEKVIAGDGLMIAAHIDRPQYSVLSQLGFIPPGIAWDAVEISASCDDVTAERLAGGRPWVRNSDAHLPEHIGQCWNECELDGFRVAELRVALRDGKVKAHRRVALAK